MAIPGSSADKDDLMELEHLVVRLLERGPDPGDPFARFRSLPHEGADGLLRELAQNALNQAFDDAAPDHNAVCVSLIVHLLTLVHSRPQDAPAGTPTVPTPADPASADDVDGADPDSAEVAGVLPPAPATTDPPAPHAADDPERSGTDAADALHRDLEHLFGLHEAEPGWAWTMPPPAPAGVWEEALDSAADVVELPPDVHPPDAVIAFLGLLAEALAILDLAARRGIRLTWFPPSEHAVSLTTSSSHDLRLRVRTAVRYGLSPSVTSPGKMTTALIDLDELVRGVVPGDPGDHQPVRPRHSGWTTVLDRLLQSIKSIAPGAPNDVVRWFPPGEAYEPVRVSNATREDVLPAESVRQRRPPNVLWTLRLAVTGAAPVAGRVLYERTLQ